MFRKAMILLFALFIPADGAADNAALNYFAVDREFYPYYPSLVKWNKSNAAFTDPGV